MFWSGNYIQVRELKFLLKEENVTLTQVLEADDILQECKADNKALIQFLTKPEILAELITLITEEPPKNVELASQYRHANIASEVIASNPYTLTDRLSSDAVQMNRLCDFVNREPPLNPLLASYFSKTIETLFQRSSKQDWYLHHIVCLRVLDFFKSRRDFLPNLLRHISTSAICDTLRCFLSLLEPFHKIVIEWFDEHQFLESLIQIICGTYEDAPPAPLTPAPPPPANNDDHCEKLDSNHNAEKDDPKPDETDTINIVRRRRRGVAAANVAALLCDVALDVCCAVLASGFRGGYGARELMTRLRGEDAVRRLLQAAFTAPHHARRAALVHTCRLLLALLRPGAQAGGAEEGAAEGAAELERAIAPHLPLLHHALLRNNDHDDDYDLPALRLGVGAERVAAAALLARLALSEVDDVATALITLGTAGVLVDMLFHYPNNNFLHAQVCALVRNALDNPRFGERYARHLIEECNLLTRLMDAFEENEDMKQGGVRAGYMGHVVAALRAIDARPPALAPDLQRRWDAFRDQRLRPLLDRLDTPLGGVYPSENTYEAGTGETLDEGYDMYLPQFIETAASAEAEAEAEAEGEADAETDAYDPEMVRNVFLETARRRFDDNMWDDTPDDDASAPPAASPWEGGSSECSEGWAQFDTFADNDPFAHSDPFWPSAGAESSEHNLSGGFEDDDKDTLTILLAQKMLTAFHNMAPDDDDTGAHVAAGRPQQDAGAGAAHAASADASADASAVRAPSDTHGTNAAHDISATHATSDTSTHDASAASDASAAQNTQDSADTSDTSATSDACSASGADASAGATEEAAER